MHGECLWIDGKRGTHAYICELRGVDIPSAYLYGSSDTKLLEGSLRSFKELLEMLLTK